MQRGWLRAACALIVIAVGSVGAAHAAAQIEVLDTYPAGDDVTLDRNQTFYVHLHYSTDHPIHIWVRPYFHGQPANAGTDGSLSYTGSGEIIGWFFMMSNRGEVDEIRVETDDGSRTESLALTYPVHVTGSERDGPSEPQPEWLTRLRAQETARERQAYQASMSEPISVGTSLLVSLFMWSMLAVGVCGFVLPLRALARWRGGWRMAAVVPVALMSFVVLRLFVGVSRDPTSHNLWPFEILMAGGLNVLIMLALWLMRRATETAAP